MSSFCTENDSAQQFSSHFDNQYARLPEHFFTRVAPTPRAGAALLDVSPECLAQLGMSEEFPGLQALQEVMGGQRLWPGMDPLAQKYTGHQFGIYNPDLGDGRGLLLGEWKNDRGQLFDLHLKGAGVTPYSRFADGQAVLRSSVREYLGSAAMAGLGIATTQALALASNTEQVRRERWEPGATLLRVAPSHVRFGHFEWLSQQGQPGDMAALVELVIKRCWPESEGAPSPTLAMFEHCARATAEMIAGWQIYGFVHGVMNTDNMSIMGLTFDYGPYAFQDRFDPDFNPNHTDMDGRYSFSQQPDIGMWNLSVLASTLLEQVAHELDDREGAVEALKAALGHYGDLVNERYGEGMRARLGLGDETEGDPRLLADFLDLLKREQHDYHRAFRCLADWSAQGPGEGVLTELGNSPAMQAWYQRYHQRIESSQPGEIDYAARKNRMDKVNPIYILRTHLAQEAIQALEQQGDAAQLKCLRQLLSDPFNEQPGMDYYAKAPSSHAPVCLSCSS